MSVKTELQKYLEQYLEHAKSEMFPKLKSSAISVTLLNDNPDPKLCLELGAAILFDKPLIIVVSRGERVSSNLRRVATVILEGNPNDPAFQLQLTNAIHNILANDERAK